MPAEIIDGNRLAKTIRSETRRRVKKLKFKPGIAVVQVGGDPASTIYVDYKQKDCERVHFHSEVYRMSGGATQEEVIDQIQTLNGREEIHAILAQMPVPNQIDGQAVIDAIAPEKDTDGLGAANLGNLMINRECVLPCTPAGIVRLIESTGEEIEGKHAVCVGRSSLVGKPIGLILLNRNATVTYCHSRTRDLAEQARSADILIAAVGKPEMIKAEMVKEGAIVIDVGINRLAGRLVGDVDYEKVKEAAGFITPVPGGVGPMTRAILLENTLKLALAQCG